MDFFIVRYFCILLSTEFYKCPAVSCSFRNELASFERVLAKRHRLRRSSQRRIRAVRVLLLRSTDTGIWSPTVSYLSMPLRREWLAGTAGALAALALALWAPLAAALPLLGLLALVRALAGAAKLWLPPALPRALVSNVGRRAVLVTGCDSGFGRATALRLDALGAPVFAAVLMPKGPGALSLAQEGSSRMRVLPLDVTDDASVAAAADVVAKDIADKGYELWAIVNNAGILTVGEAEWTQLDDIRKSMDVNALGQVRVTKAFLPLLKKSKGRVVNINSMASRLVVSTITPYTMSKFASLAFTESLRIDMKKFAISVHSIEPSIFKTPMFESCIPLYKQRLREIPDEVVSTYYDKYAEKFLKILTFIFSVAAMPYSKIYQVVDAIEDACFARDPQDRYLPGEVTKLLESIKGIIFHFQSVLLTLFYKYA